MMMNKTTILLALCAWASIHAQAQKITAKTDVIDCGSVLYERPVTVKFEMQNSGFAPLTIKTIKTSCGCTSVEYPHSAIPAGDGFTISATYDARQLGHFMKDVGIYSNASDKPYYLSIRGIVVEELVDYEGTYDYTLADIRADKNDIEFDDVTRGDMPMEKIHIMNGRTKSITPTVMHLPDYLNAIVSPTTIAPGRQGTISISLDSRKLRDYGLTQTSIFLGMFPGDKVAPEKEITVSAVLLPSFTQYTESQLENAPEILLSREYVDLDFGKKSKKTELVSISNVGKSPLDINSLQLSTAGLKVKLDKRHIKPHETTMLRITADAKVLRNVRTKPRVLMITNAPGAPKLVIPLNVK